MESQHSTRNDQCSKRTRPWRGKIALVGSWQFEAAIVAVAAVLFGIVFSQPLLHSMSGAGTEADWDYFAEHLWAASRTLTYYHQFPMWDPYRCGGTPLFASPFLPLLSPLAILRVIFPPMVGLHLEVPLYLAIGWAGGYFLARVIGIGPLGAIACAAVCPASSWFYLHFAVGHFNFMPFLYVPWLVALIWLAQRDRIVTVSVLGGLLGAVIFFESGPTVVLFSAPLLAVVVIGLTAARRQPWPVVAALGIAIFATGFSAIKLLPTLALVSSRPVGSRESDSAAILIYALFSRDQNIHTYLPGLFWRYHEYGAYIGAWCGALAAVGVAARPRSALLWVLGALVLFAMSAGRFAWWAPWPLLHHLPFFRSEHVQPRFLILLTLAVGVLAGFGADSLTRWVRPWGAIAAAAIILIGMADAWLVSVPNLRFNTRDAPSDLPPVAPFRQSWNKSDHGMLSAALSNLGAINCYSPMKRTLRAMGYNQSNYRGEQYLVGPGQIALTEWSPNRLEYEVSADGPAQLVINQTFDQGWHLAQGRGDLGAFNGLLSVSIPPGRQHVVVVYRAPWFVIGSAISAATLMLATLLCWIEMRSDRVPCWFRPGLPKQTARR